MPIEPISHDDLGAHIEPARLESGDGSYEWWYFEIKFVVGGTKWRLVTSLHYPHAFDPARLTAVDGVGSPLLRRSALPSEYAGVVTSVLRDQDAIGRFIDKLDPSGVSTSRGSAPVDLRFNQRAHVQEVSRDPLRLRLRISQRWRARWIRFDVTLGAHSPGFRPGGGVLLVDACKDVHRWVVPMPNAIVKIHDLSLRTYHRGRRVSLELHGHDARGYHDHQWGPALPHHRIYDWSWGRVGFNAPAASRQPDQLLFFQSRPCVPRREQIEHTLVPKPILVMIPGDGGTPRALQTPPRMKGFRLEKQVKDRDPAGSRLEYYARLRIDALDGNRPLSLRLEQDNDHEVDTWPIYKRFLPAVFPRDGVYEAISEYLQPVRLNDAKLLRVFRIGSLGKTSTEDGSPGR